MPANYTRETSAAEHRENFRRKVEAAARRGESPSQNHDAADLAWAYAGLEAELAELEERARQAAAQAAEREADPPHLRAMRLRTERDKVLAEWDEQRRHDAMEEARRRLGLEDA